MANKFMIGDRVRVFTAEEMKSKFGKDWERFVYDKYCFVGRMKQFLGQTFTIASMQARGIVLFEENNWTFYSDYLKPVNDTIVIYRNGKETVAINKSTGSKAIAKCHPDDKYDFEIGAKLSFDRLMNLTDTSKDDVKLLNGRYVVINENTSIAPLGTVLDVKDGKFVLDNTEFPYSEPLVDEDDLKRYLGEIKELRMSGKGKFLTSGVITVKVIE